MGKNIAVDGCELTDITGGGDVSIESNPSDKVKADGKGIYFGAVSVKVENSYGPSGAITDGNGTGTGTITGTGSFVKSGGQNALLEGDTATIQVSGTATPPGGSPTPVGPVPVTVKVTNAGQSIVVAL